MTAPTTVLPVRARFARRIPDPNFYTSHRIERHVLLVRAQDLPGDLPLDPNPRIPNINKRVYKQVMKSLTGEEGEAGTFHLKHKGITLIAQTVQQDKHDEDLYYITFENELHGVLDGGHSLEIIETAREKDLIPDDQYVKLEVLVNVPREWIPEMAGGLNTSVQVQPMSLDNLADRFEWIKAVLRSEPYYDDIAWRENEDGEFDARDLLAMLTCFNIDLYPNSATGENHPVTAFSSKAKVLSDYEEKEHSFKKLRPIMKDVLTLYDTIRYGSREIWNDERGGRFGRLNFVAKRKRGSFPFPFIQKEGEYRLMNGALFPILGAFRWMVEEDPATGEFRWRGGFDAVMKMWEATASDLMKKTYEASKELGRNPNALGKSRNLWASLYAHVAMKDLMSRAGAPAGS